MQVILAISITAFTLLFVLLILRRRTQLELAQRIAAIEQQYDL